MMPQIGKLIEHVRTSGKVIYARIVSIDKMGRDTIYICRTAHGNQLYLTRADFRVVKTVAGSSEESFNTIFKG